MMLRESANFIMRDKLEPEGWRRGSPHRTAPHGAVGTCRPRRALAAGRRGAAWLGAQTKGP